MKQLNYMWLIALKDLKIFVKDRAAVFFFIIFPFMFILMFYFLNLGQAGDTRLTYHLVTREAEGGLSHQIIGAMETKDESQLQPGAPVIVWDRDYDEAYTAVENGELSGFIAFPSDFTWGIESGAGAQLEVVVDAGAVNDRAALNGVAASIASQVGGTWVAVNAAVTLQVEGGLVPPDEESINQAAQQILAQITAAQSGAGGQLSLISFDIERVGDVEEGNPADYVIPGYLVMFVFFAAAATAETIVRERQNNTLERLLASSVRKSTILGGVYTGTAVRGLIQIILFWGIGILVFKVDLGHSPLAVIILSLLMVIMSSAFAVMLATLVKTQRSASSLATVTALILAPLGGCWWPLFILPEWLQTVAKISPHAWANTGFNKLMLFGADFGAVVPEMLALVVFTVIFGAIAIWRFRTSAV
jgi:ABC-2 type transport system permease protein